MSALSPVIKYILLSISLLKAKTKVWFKKNNLWTVPFVSALYKEFLNSFALSSADFPPSIIEGKIKYDTINEIGEVKGFKGDIMIRNEDSNSWTKISAIICRCERKLSKEDEFHALLSRGII